MKVLSFNGSPRKNWNTATLLSKALEGAASQGAETEFIHLNDLNFKGCQSCFSCKTRGGKSYGKCAVKDDLTPILEKVQCADAIILGSPIYLGTVTGVMRAFMERLIFPHIAYDIDLPTLFTKKIKTGFVYTMNMPDDMLKSGRLGLDKHLSTNEMLLKRIFGASESLFSTDTYQFEDYLKVVAPRFNPEKKAKRRREVFPLDCVKAFEMGVRFAKADE
ncbi:flavodoxin family protein [Chloroflexota bacterium]